MNKKPPKAYNVPRWVFMNIHIKIASFLLVFALVIPFFALFASADSTALGSISARSACLIEAESQRVIYSKSSSTQMPMASTTKIMTAIIALESGISLDFEVNVSPKAVGIEGSSAYLKNGEKVKFEVLLYALMLSSANDAAVAIAIAVSGSVEDFVALMNEKAQALGLSNTHFTNPHGLYDENHYTSALDLARLMAYAMNDSVFAQITATQKKAFSRDDGTSFLFTNHNRLLKTYDGVIGGKTGFTKKSGRCLVTSAERDGLLLIAVTLDAPDDWNDHAKLYDFGFSSYERVYFGAQNMKIPVISGEKSEINVSSRAFSMVLPKEHGEICAKIYAPRFLFAGISKGEQLGKVIFLHDGQVIAASPLYADDDVAKIKYKFNLFDWLKDFLKDFLDKWKK